MYINKKCYTHYFPFVFFDREIKKPLHSHFPQREREKESLNKK